MSLDTPSMNFGRSSLSPWARQDAAVRLEVEVFRQISPQLDFRKHLVTRHVTGNSAGRWVPQIQLRELITVVAAVASEQAARVTLRMSGNQKIRNDTATLTAARAK